MFDELVDSSPVKRKRTSPWAFAISLSFQVILIISMILVTMIQMEALPDSMQLTFLSAPPPPPPPPPPPAAKVVRRIVRRVSQVQAGKVIAPKVIPKEIAEIIEEDIPPDVGGVMGGVAGGIAGGQMGGVIGGVIGGIPSAAPPPPAAPIRISSGVQSAKRVRYVKPVFPPIARQARITGTVRLEAVIGRDGAIRNLKPLSGHPLLTQSAIQAVQQWRYAPTLLNGEAVEVITLIDVVFKL
jgi:protein TonB